MHAHFGAVWLRATGHDFTFALLSIDWIRNHKMQIKISGGAGCQ
jgi:hypothetical protein